MIKDMGLDGRGPAAMAKIELVESCNTALQCKCGAQSFRVFMEVDEATDELSHTLVNNLECAACHQLYQVRLRT